MRSSSSITLIQQRMNRKSLNASIFNSLKYSSKDLSKYVLLPLWIILRHNVCSSRINLNLRFHLTINNNYHQINKAIHPYIKTLLTKRILICRIVINHRIRRFRGVRSRLVYLVLRTTRRIRNPIFKFSLLAKIV